MNTFALWIRNLILAEKVFFAISKELRRLSVMLLVFTFLPCMAFTQYNDHRNRHVDSLEQVLATNPPTGKELRLIYLDLMTGYQQINIEKSMEYARKTISLSVPIDGWANVTKGYRSLGVNFYAISQYDSAMFYYGKALEAAEKMRDFPEKYNDLEIDDNFSSAYGNIGNLFNVQGKYHEAIDYYTRALRIFEKHDWKESQSLVYENIGEMYLSMDNYKQAELNFSKFDSLAHVTGDSLHITYAKKHFSRLYLCTHEYDKALQNAKIAYNYFISNPEEGGEKMVILNLLAEIYLEGYSDEVQAEQYARQALQMLDPSTSPREKAISLRIISTLHLRRGQWRNAEKTALEALASDDSEPANTLVLYEILAKVYGKFGNSDKSWAYFDKHNALQSSWSNKNYQSAIREIEVKYETEKKEFVIASLETENRLLVYEKRLLILLGIAIGGILLLVSLLFWRKRKHAETRIRHLEQEKQLVATQSVLDGEIKERSRLARDLHDGLGSLLTGAKMRFVEMKQNAKFEPSDVERFEQGLDLLEQSVNEMRLVAHHLMPDSLTRFGLKAAVADFCSLIPTVEFIYYGDEMRHDAQLEVMIYRCIYELVNNALKHSGAANIIVQIMQRPDSIAFTVQDDGCGFDPSSITKGTGLQNIRSRVATYNGIINVDSKDGEGTEVNVELKIEITHY